MKYLLTIMLTASFIAIGCNRNAPRNTQAASEQRPVNRDQMRNARDNYVNGAEARLSEFDKKIDGLDERADAMTGPAKTDFKKAIDGLRDERKSLGDKLDELKNASAESWTTMKGGVDLALANLDRSYTGVATMASNSPDTSRQKPQTQ
jgi:hypothetical protein